jgi:hypothetical protein
VTERDSVSINAYLSDADLRRFAREQARLFFGGNLSRYIETLLRMDRESGTVREEIARRLAGSVEDREAVA